MSSKKTSANCSRTECCKVGKLGKITRVIACEFTGEEKCEETFYTQCHMKDTKKKLPN